MLHNLLDAPSHLYPATVQELHGGAAFQPPPSAPLPSLERASTLAKQSLARRSSAGPNLGKMSRRQQSIGERCTFNASRRQGHLVLYHSCHAGIGASPATFAAFVVRC
jgi:hypothetical protein